MATAFNVSTIKSHPKNSSMSIWCLHWLIRRSISIDKGSYANRRNNMFGRQTPLFPELDGSTKSLFQHNPRIVIIRSLRLVEKVNGNALHK